MTNETIKFNSSKYQQLESGIKYNKTNFNLILHWHQSLQKRQWFPLIQGKERNFLDGERDNKELYFLADVAKSFISFVYCLSSIDPRLLFSFDCPPNLWQLSLRAFFLFLSIFFLIPLHHLAVVVPPPPSALLTSCDWPTVTQPPTILSTSRTSKQNIFVCKKIKK